MLNVKKGWNKCRTRPKVPRCHGFAGNNHKIQLKCQKPVDNHLRQNNNVTILKKKNKV